MAPFASIRDNFSDNLIASCWTSYAIGSATVAETSGQARFTLPSSTAGSHEAGYSTNTVAYDLTSDSFYINIGTMVATGVAATAFFDLRLAAASILNVLRWRQVSNTVSARHIVGGVDTQVYSATWSATTYKYLRIRADTTTVYWDSSSDGTTWTNRASVAISSLFAISSLYAVFGALCGNVASPGGFYLDDVNLILPALTTNWRWTQARWPLTNRHRTITLALDTAGTAQAYLVTADDVDVSDNPTGSIRYWSGPADGGRELTEQTTQAAAQDMAVDIPLDGRFDLPQQIDARVFRVYHRSIDGAAYTIRELYPRRLIQADDVDAEIIRGLVVSGHRFICDELSALTANVGVLTAGVIDGVTIYAGGAGHPVTLDSTGIFITFDDDVTSADASLRFLSSAGATVGALEGYNAVVGSQHQITLKANNAGVNKGSETVIAAQRDGTGVAHIGLTCTNTSGPPSVRIDVYDNHTTNGDYIDINAPLVWIDGNTIIQNSSLNVESGLNVGTATGATDGQIIAEVTDSGTTTVPLVLVLAHDSSATPAAGFGTDLRFQGKSNGGADRYMGAIEAVWVVATDASRTSRMQLYAYDNASARQWIRGESNGSAAMIGFLGGAAAAKQTVTGSRGGNAALASLLTALATYGLVTDSST